MAFIFVVGEGRRPARSHSLSFGRILDLPYIEQKFYNTYCRFTYRMEEPWEQGLKKIHWERWKFRKKRITEFKLHGQFIIFRSAGKRRILSLYGLLH